VPETGRDTSLPHAHAWRVRGAEMYRAHLLLRNDITAFDIRARYR
jgi:hypothetical protein